MIHIHGTPGLVERWAAWEPAMATPGIWAPVSALAPDQRAYTTCTCLPDTREAREAWWERWRDDDAAH